MQMNLFLQLLGNGIVQGAVAMLNAAEFGFAYRLLRVSPSQGRVKAGTFDSRQFLNPDWLVTSH